MKLSLKHLGCILAGIGALLALVAFFFLPYFGGFAYDWQHMPGGELPFLNGHSLISPPRFDTDTSYYPMVQPLSAAQIVTVLDIRGVGWWELLWLEAMSAGLVLVLVVMAWRRWSSLAQAGPERSSRQSWWVGRIVRLPVVGIVTLLALLIATIIPRNTWLTPSFLVSYDSGFWLYVIGMGLVVIGGVIEQVAPTQRQALLPLLQKSVLPLLTCIVALLALFAFLVFPYERVIAPTEGFCGASIPAGENFTNACNFSVHTTYTGMGFYAHITKIVPFTTVATNIDTWLLIAKPIMTLLMVILVVCAWLRVARAPSVEQNGSTHAGLVPALGALLLGLLSLVTCSLPSGIFFNQHWYYTLVSRDIGFWLYVTGMGMATLCSLVLVLRLVLRGRAAVRGRVQREVELPMEQRARWATN